MLPDWSAEQFLRRADELHRRSSLSPPVTAPSPTYESTQYNYLPRFLRDFFRRL